MLPYLIPLVESWIPFWEAYMIPLFALSIVSFAIGFVRCIFSRG